MKYPAELTTLEPQIPQTRTLLTWTLLETNQGTWSVFQYLPAIRQQCHVQDLINIPELGKVLHYIFQFGPNTGTF